MVCYPASQRWSGLVKFPIKDSLDLSKNIKTSFRKQTLIRLSGSFAGWLCLFFSIWALLFYLLLSFLVVCDAIYFLNHIQGSEHSVATFKGQSVFLLWAFLRMVLTVETLNSVTVLLIVWLYQFFHGWQVLIHSSWWQCPWTVIPVLYYVSFASRRVRCMWLPPSPEIVWGRKLVVLDGFCILKNIIRKSSLYFLITRF
jgi:hypothetical protein